MLSQSVMDEAKKWLDWAYGSASAQNWDDATWNIAQFQAVYANNYYQGDATQQAKLMAMNSRAATLLSLLSSREAGNVQTDWKAPFIPDTVMSAINQAGDTAALAASSGVTAGNLALRQGAVDTLAYKQAVIQQQEVPIEHAQYVASAPNAYKDFLGQNWLGIPVWGWLLGGVAAVILVKR